LEVFVKKPGLPAGDRGRPNRERPGEGAELRIPADAEAMLDAGSTRLHISCRIVEIGFTGCSLVTRERTAAGTRVHVSFQLGDTGFRISGVVGPAKANGAVDVRFDANVQPPNHELVEALCELAAQNAVKKVRLAAERLAPAESAEAPAEETIAARAQPGRERRNQGRRPVDTTATIFLVNVASRISGRILNLSLGGCRIRTKERFPVGIFTRVETEFHLEGLPFRLAGVIQTIQDRFSVGIRFLDMSERKREQLVELIAEIDALREADSAAASV
jgi:hypothetical protein